MKGGLTSVEEVFHIFASAYGWITAILHKGLETVLSTNTNLHQYQVAQRVTRNPANGAKHTALNATDTKLKINQ